MKSNLKGVIENKLSIKFILKIKKRIFSPSKRNNVIKNVDSYEDRFCSMPLSEEVFYPLVTKIFYEHNNAFKFRRFFFRKNGEIKLIGLRKINSTKDVKIKIAKKYFNGNCFQEHIKSMFNQKKLINRIN